MSRRKPRPRRLLRYETRSEKLLPVAQFVPRLLRHVGAAVLLIGACLGIGVLGYRYFQDLSWIDALLNASMILTGMGPVDKPECSAAKLFASAYAIFSGVAFITGAGIGFAPLAHRLLHRFHLDENDQGDSGAS